MHSPRLTCLCEKTASHVHLHLQLSALPQPAVRLDLHVAVEEVQPLLQHQMLAQSLSWCQSSQPRVVRAALLAEPEAQALAQLPPEPDLRPLQQVPVRKCKLTPEPSNATTALQE